MVRLSDPAAIIEFGHFRIFPHRRQLLAAGRPIRLGGRAFDVLMALIEGSGAVVGKDELLGRVWQGRIVDENRLPGEIAALRKAFGAERELIRTVTGRGYQFTGEIRESSVGAGEREALAAATGLRPRTNLPEAVSELIGREEALSEVTDLVTTHRLVTLIGAGGIGKTRLGLEVARHLFGEFADGVWVAELAPLSNPDLVPLSVAVALGLDLSGGAVSAERLANAVAAKQLMLLLDNCEHVIDAAANMAGALLRANSASRVLATSREPLRIEGESLYRVPPLAVPSEGIQNVEELLRHGAVRLFVARARTADPHFSLEGRVAADAAAICRRLDGIPLAIELAAARSAALGIAEVASRLDDRFRLLTDGHRTALPRHQTLRATLDWSYKLLSEPERVVLRRLAIFAGGITLAAASAVAADAEVAAWDVVDCLAKLITKSLVAPDGNDTVAHYRLLETTRAYALEKLVESGEAGAVARRHADYYRRLCERVEAERETTSATEPVEGYRRHVDNLHAALDWAFSPSGDASLGVALTVASIPLWFRLSLMEECHGRAERALAALQPGSSHDACRKMHLYSALASSLPYIKGVVPEFGAAWKKALEIAESLDEAEYQLRALWGLWDFYISDGQYRVALECAQKFRALAEHGADLADQLIGDRLIGLTQHYLGDQPSARCHIERVLSRYVAPIRSDIIRFRSDQRVQASVSLARILWLQGFPDQAIRTAQSSVEDARAVDHAISVCLALAMAACPVAFWVGDLAAAEHYVGMLLDHSTRHGLAAWQPWGRCFEGVLLIERGDVITGLQHLRDGLDELGRPSQAARFMTFQGILAGALGRAGEVAEGFAAIDKGLERSERTEGRWVIAELLRRKGELLLLHGGRGAVVAAEDHFRQALDWAGRQGALSWELRAATSLARLRRNQGRTEDAQQLLAPIYGRLTEGYETEDLRAAKALIDDLR
jgi:predicted ATPase/DNA-binding winged helix-turn-helix (wHTH) protein